MNGGYYIARYEASYGSGSSVADYKPLSKVSTATNFSTSTVGSLWNNVKQIDATKISRNMYENDNNVGVESDLVNSYAWDTAIVFIQEMGNTNYANKRSVNRTIANTGITGDKVCNIHDTASNCQEWTTEYSTATIKGGRDKTPCVQRGGNYYESCYTANRQYHYSDYGDSQITFRLVIYFK